MIFTSSFEWTFGYPSTDDRLNGNDTWDQSLTQLFSRVSRAIKWGLEYWTRSDFDGGYLFTFLIAFGFWKIDKMAANFLKAGCTKWPLFYIQHSLINSICMQWGSENRPFENRTFLMSGFWMVKENGRLSLDLFIYKCYSPVTCK